MRQNVIESGAVALGERDALRACLLLCLDDAQKRSPRSVLLLAAAVEMLGENVEHRDVSMIPDVCDPFALAAFLRYLAPDLKRQSSEAARLVEDAAAALVPFPAGAARSKRAIN